MSDLTVAQFVALKELDCRDCLLVNGAAVGAQVQRAVAKHLVGLRLATYRGAYCVGITDEGRYVLAGIRGDNVRAVTELRP